MVVLYYTNGMNFAASNPLNLIMKITGSDAVHRRINEKLMAFLAENGNLNTIQKVQEATTIFDGMIKLMPQWMIMTCPRLNPDILYVSQNAKHVLGYTQDFWRQDNIPNYFDYVFESDKEDLNACYKFIHEFLQTVAPGDHLKYRYVLHYRFLKPDGRPIYIHDEKAVLDLSHSDLIYYILIRDLTPDKKFNGVKVEIFRRDETVVKVREYKPSGLNTNLTNRENELVSLIHQGFSTKEIAGLLKISHHTVRNIKSRLFEKYKVSNSIELLNLAAS